MGIGTRRGGKRHGLRHPPVQPTEEPGTDLLRLSTHNDGRGVVVVELSGEMDLTTAPQLVATVQGLQVPPAPRGLLVLLDLSRLDFCDAMGLNAMVRSARVLGERGARLALAAPRRPLAKLLKITGLDQHFEVFPSLPSAEISPTVRPLRCGTP